MDAFSARAITASTNGPKTWTDPEVEAVCMCLLELALQQRADDKARVLVRGLIQRMRAAIDSLAGEAGGRQ